MKKVSIIFFSTIIALLFPLICYAEWVDADKSGQEGIVVDSNQGQYPSLALDNSNRPHIAYLSSTAIYYLKWNGASWVDIDGSGQESAMVYDPSGVGGGVAYVDLRLNSGQNPCLGFSGDLDGGSSSDVGYLYWNGSAWVDADGSGQESVIVYNGSSMSSSFDLDSQDRPQIAWAYQSGGFPFYEYNIYFLKYNGSAWVDVDGSGQESIAVTSDNVSSFPSLTINLQNNPCLAYTRVFATSAYLYWNGSAWVDADGSGQESISIGYTGTNFNLKINSANNPSLTFDYTSGNLEIGYLQWNGGAWVDADGSGQEGVNISQTSGSSYSPSLALNNQDDKPAIAWQDETGNISESDLYYLFWNGNDWVDADGSGREGQLIYQADKSNLHLRYPSLALDSIHNFPFIAWCRDDLGNRSLYFMEWYVEDTGNGDTLDTLPQTGMDFVGYVNKLLLE